MALNVPGGFANAQVEKFGDPNAITYTVIAGQAATGARLVEGATGDRQVRTAQANSRLVRGVAMHDAAAGEKVSVARGGTWMLRAAGAITGGQRVKAAAGGTVVPLAAADDSDLSIGVAEADIANGADGPVKVNC